MFTYVNSRKYLFQSAFAKQIIDIKNKKNNILKGNLQGILLFT